MKSYKVWFKEGSAEDYVYVHCDSSGKAKQLAELHFKQTRGEDHNCKVYLVRELMGGKSDE